MKALNSPRLRHSADVRTLLFTAGTLGLLFVNWSNIGRSAWSILAAFPFSFAAAIITHNQMHVPIFTRRFWKNSFQCCLAFATGQSPTGIISAHNERHHGLNQSDQDFVRTSLVPSTNKLVGLLAFPFASIAEMYRTKPSDLKRWKQSNPTLYRQAVRERLLFYCLGFILLLTSPINTIVFLWLPWSMAQVCLIGMNLLQHRNCAAHSEFDHSRNVTGCFANWFLFNNGYHTAHHIRSALHWSQLPNFHRSISHQIDADLNHPSLTHLIWSHLTHSK